jgi:hypothetical protein
VATHVRKKSGDRERRVKNGVNWYILVRKAIQVMRMYDVYRYNDLVARVRILENGKIEWAYRQARGDWQGFWWSNDIKRTIEQFIERYPELEELVVSEFTLRRCGN